METSTKTETSLENLSHLPSYAQYILQNRLDDFTLLQMQLAEEIDIPLKRFFKETPYDQQLQITKDGAKELLTYLSQNKAKQQIEASLERWKENMLPNISRDDIATEDITLITYLRKKSLTYFISDYTSDLNDAIEIIKEIDLFLVASETAATSTYINLLKEKISKDDIALRNSEYLYKKAEAITHLGSYRWDIKTNHLTWSD